MKASSLILSFCAALLGLTGCSTPCENVCSAFNECTLEQRDHKVDCSTFCSREQDFEEKAAASGADTCKAEFDAHIACWETNIDSICTPDSTPTPDDPTATTFKCQTEATAWTDCVAKFCAVEANATDPACVPQDEGPALPAMSGF